MKILVGLSGASGVELGFYLLSALEKYTNSNDEIFAIISKGAKMSFCAEYRHCEKRDSVSWLRKRSVSGCVASASHEAKSINSHLTNIEREFKGENSALCHCERAKSEVKQSTQNKSETSASHEAKSINSQSTNSHLQNKKSEFKAQNLSQNDKFIAFCKEQFALHKTQFLDDENLAASVASGSFGINATIIAPCSLNSLAKIKRGIADTLITRSAAVALKERKKLILGVREMPFSTLALKQMTKLSKMGVIIAPPVFASYTNATNLDDLRKFIIGKWLDLLEIPHDLYKRWQSS